MKFGLKAEEWVVELLRRNGTEVVHADSAEDRVFKVDFWVEHDGYWLPIQFSVNKKAVIGWKGLDAVRRGIVPMWIADQELEIAYSNGNGAGLVKEFWTHVEKLLTTFPNSKRFRKPQWNSYSTQLIT